jgi:heme A synthase
MKIIIRIAEYKLLLIFFFSKLDLIRCYKWAQISFALVVFVQRPVGIYRISLSREARTTVGHYFRYIICDRQYIVFGGKCSRDGKPMKCIEDLGRKT